MSDVPPPAHHGRPAPKKGTGLGQKVGPLPLWAWIGGAVVVVYFLYKKAASGSQGANCPAGYVYDPNSQQCVQVASSATSGATTTTSQSPFPTIGGVFEPLQQQQGAPSTPASTNPALTGASPATSNEQYVGGGYAGPTVTGGATNQYGSTTYPLTSILTTAGSTLNPISSSQWAAYQQNGWPTGESVYYQPSPGLFIPAAAANVAPGTPLWLGPQATSTSTGGGTS